MSDNAILSLTDDQINGLQASVDQLDLVIKNGAAFIEVGTMTQADLDKAKATRKIALDTITAFKKK